MHRGITGDYENAATTGEPVRAFVPRPLPPDPPLALVNSRQRIGVLSEPVRIVRAGDSVIEARRILEWKNIF
jgi:hypothetical protein